MGIVIVFIDSADFSLMSPASTRISFVLQKTLSEVNEKVAEATAATVVVIIQPLRVQQKTDY